MKTLQLPLSIDAAQDLRCGDTVKIDGVLYTARDAAHKRIVEALRRCEEPPFPLRDACIYYTGPCPAKPGQIVNSCGPTTSKRMDAYAPLLYEKGVRCVLGKGPVGKAVRDAIARYRCVYFTMTGGVGALIAQCVRAAECVAYEDLGAEAIYRLRVAGLPAVVAVDIYGNDIFQSSCK